MGTTQRKEQRKMKLEKEIIRLTKLHQNKDKRELIQNINHVLRAQGIHLNRKVKWICKVTGSPEGTVYTWFTNARCRRENKIPLYALCQMALALRISVYEFFSADHFMEIADCLQSAIMLYYQSDRSSAAIFLVKLRNICGTLAFLQELPPCVEKKERNCPHV